MPNSSTKTQKRRKKKKIYTRSSHYTVSRQQREQTVTRRQCSVNKWGQFYPGSIMSTYFSRVLQTEEEKSAVILCGL